MSFKLFTDKLKYVGSEKENVVSLMGANEL